MKLALEPDVDADSAIVRVLNAECAARESVERAATEVGLIAENARAQARRLQERTEQRVQAVAERFERERLARLAQISAAMKALEQTQPLTADDAARVQGAVQSVAQQLIRGQP